MRTRKILMMVSIASAALIAVLIVGRWVVVRTADPLLIETREGRRLEGLLLALEPSLYLAQGDSFCMLLPGDEIVRAGGRVVREALPPVADRVARTFETWETISPGGEIEVRSTVRMRNESKRTIQEVDWVFLPKELDRLNGYRILDGFSNEIPYRLEDHPASGGKRLRARLLRPVLPGEELRLTTIHTDRGSVARQGAEWVYRAAGDYPDPRLVNRTIRLPAGAEVVSVSPEPLSRVEGEAPIVMWRRFFLPGERAPWEIRYRLRPPAPDPAGATLSGSGA